MKRIIAILLILAPIVGMAQESNPQDTTLYVGNRKYVIKETEDNIRVKIYEKSVKGDTIENDQIFEGVYKDGRSTERRIALTVPFMKKEKKYKGHFDKHVAGFYIGYSQFGDDMGLSRTDDIDLVSSKSWEWGLNLFEGSLRLSRQWGITSGLGFGYRSFRVDGNYGFEERDGITDIYPSPDGVDYRRSRLRYYHLRLPISVEWQKKFGYKGPLFFSLGAEVETRFWVRSKTIIDDDKQTLSKDLNVRPLGINILAQGGYGDWGFYCRCATASLFEKNKGPELYPFSFGVQWYW